MAVHSNDKVHQVQINDCDFIIFRYINEQTFLSEFTRASDETRKDNDPGPVLLFTANVSFFDFLKRIHSKNKNNHNQAIY